MSDLSPQGSSNLQSTPAGWYPDPSLPNTQRYWDGQAWSQQVAPLAATYGAPVSETSLYAILALVLAFVFAPLGIVFGVLGRREIDASEGRKTGRALATAGMWVGIVSCGFFVIYFVILIALFVGTAANGN
jgi:MFS family permease